MEIYWGVLRPILTNPLPSVRDIVSEIGNQISGGEHQFYKKALDIGGGPNLGGEKMEKSSKILGPLNVKGQNEFNDTGHTEFDERFVNAEWEDDICLENGVGSVIKDASALIEIYCRSEGLRIDAVNFEIAIDGEGDKYWLTVKIENAYDAMRLVASLIKRKYAKYFLKLRDNSSGKVIFIMAAFGKNNWLVGIEGNNEEVDEWDKRNRNYAFSCAHPRLDRDKDRFPKHSIGREEIYQKQKEE